MGIAYRQSLDGYVALRLLTVAHAGAERQVSPRFGIIE